VVEDLARVHAPLSIISRLFNGLQLLGSADLGNNILDSSQFLVYILNMRNEPRTLQEAIKYFADPDNCLNFLVARRWPNGVVCPTCGSREISFVPSRRLWQCKNRHPKCQFSVKVGTIFEDSHIPLDKWLCAMWMRANCKNGISSYEIHRALGITQKSAWFVLHRIRLAMQTNSLVKIGGPGSEVEVDETFIGGRSRYMHKEVRKRRITMNGPGDKTAVLGMLERGGKVRAMVASNIRKPHVQGEVRKHVDAGSVVYTGALLSYKGLDQEYIHKTIDHAVKYVSGSVHQQPRKLLEPLEAWDERELHQRRAVPPVPLFG